MPSINKVYICGHVGSEPKIVQTKNGGTIANFSVATSRFYKDAQNNTVEETEWHRIVVFGRSAEYASKLKKGGLVFIEGRLNTTKYTDKDGIERTQTKIIAEKLSSLEKREGSQQQSQSQYQQAQQQSDSYDEHGDDVPF